MPPYIACGYYRVNLINNDNCVTETVYASLITFLTVLSPPKSVKDTCTRVSHSLTEGKEVQQSKLSKQVCRNDGVNLDTSYQTLFSKDNKRKAHTPTHHANTPGKAH